MTQLRELHIGGCGGLTTFSSICNLSQLTTLELYGCSTNVASFAGITRTLTQLQQLSFRNVRGFSDVGDVMRNIGMLTSLQMLSLDQCGDSDPEQAYGLESMAAAVFGLTGLRRLLLWRDNARYLADRDWLPLQRLALLTRLTLSCPVSDEQMLCVSQLAELRTLELCVAGGLTNNAMHMLAQITGLVNLDLQECPSIEDSGVEHLAARVRLLTFRLTSSRITDRSMAAIAQWPRLRNLSIAHSTGISDAGLKSLLSCASLKILDLGGCTGVTDAGLKSLASLRDLQQLNLERCPEVSNVGVQAFKRQLLAAGPQCATDEVMACVVVFF
jgi:F-box and leucine-rich repeat protein 14